MERLKIYIVLHFIILFYSLSAVFSKLAAGQPFLSTKFILYYGAVILVLGIYALAWQQVIKRMPLTEAYANKAISVVWGIVWGMLFFSEHISMGKIIGAAVVMLGVVIYAVSSKEERDDG